MQKFLLSKWVKKTLQALVSGVVAIWTSGQLAATVPYPPEQISAAIWVVLISGSNWLKHQTWSPKLVRDLL